MKVSLSSNTLSELASRINQEHTRCEEAVKAGIAHALEAGKLLAEAKAKVKHGGWLAWVRDNCEFSVRTAQGYMRLAANTQRVAHLSMREALRAIAAPRRKPKEGFSLQDVEAWWEGFNERFPALDMDLDAQEQQAIADEEMRVIVEVLKRLMAELAPIESENAIEALSGYKRIHDVLVPLCNWQTARRLRLERRIGRILNAFEEVSPELRRALLAGWSQLRRKIEALPSAKLNLLSRNLDGLFQEFLVLNTEMAGGNEEPENLN